jgi:spore coat polysaccharide biosynthesis protein SpsF
VIDLVVNEHLLGNCDYTSNTLTRTFPQGLDVEVAKKSSFMRLREMPLSAYEREHVMPALYSGLGEFSTRNVSQITDQSNYRWTVDTQEDLDFARMVYERFEDQPIFNSHDIFNRIPQAEQHFN